MEVKMAIEIIDPHEVGRREKQRTMVFESRKAHAWVQYYSRPGDHDELHCHNGDQMFWCIEGQCTMTFPDGGEAILTPGKVALINGGSFYKLENTGEGPMIMMGYRTGELKNSKTIDYLTGEDLRANGGKPVISNSFESASCDSATGSR
jgi:mannose-6-phosphate isomerase-like protein (cupin superfamily)